MEPGLCYVIFDDVFLVKVIINKIANNERLIPSSRYQDRKKDHRIGCILSQTSASHQRSKIHDH